MNPQAVRLSAADYRQVEGYLETASLAVWEARHRVQELQGSYIDVGQWCGYLHHAIEALSTAEGLIARYVARIDQKR